MASAKKADVIPVTADNIEELGLGTVSYQGPQEPRKTAEEWKTLGNDAYKITDWKVAIDCYTSALRVCKPESEIAIACLNNRAACHAQLKDHQKVISDASEVIKHQPANTKALMRRMVALESLGRIEEALRDAGDVLTVEPKNPHALRVVDAKRKSLSRKAQAGAAPIRDHLSVFIFSEDSPLQCYTCLLALKKHLRGVLHIHIFWQAAETECIHSYQLLQSLPEIAAFGRGSVTWMESSKGQLFPNFSRTINRLSAEGQGHVLFLSDAVLFHTDVDVKSALAVLTERRDAITMRLDVNPRVTYFPEARIFHAPPNMKTFAENNEVLLWTRWYEQEKKAYEAVARETGWNAILDWTATIVGVGLVQHFFSALLPPLETAKDMEDKAADWLSRRQRMKVSELKHRSACFTTPRCIAVKPANYGTAVERDAILRSLLSSKYLTGGSSGSSLERFAGNLGWKEKEVSEYFKDVNSNLANSDALRVLLQPELLREQYLDTLWVPPMVRAFGVPEPTSSPAPLVSWLVPVRNAEHYLHDCLKSIEAQVGLPPESCEVVFVDDGSEDGSLAVLKRLAAGKSHVRIIENGTQMGIAGSLCEGWKHCKGDFVARLDADDIAVPTRLMSQLRFLEQYKSISVVGGRTVAFWTEERKCKVEKVAQKDDGSMVAVVWREFHGNQTSRKREQLTLKEVGGELLVKDGPAEYFNCRVVAVGQESLAQDISRWRAQLREAQGRQGELTLQRRDLPEQPQAIEAFHPVLLKAHLLFGDCISGTTACFRRQDFPAQGPFLREEAEGHWSWLALDEQEPPLHAANLADVLVNSRRHEGNRAPRDHAGIYESQCAAVQRHLARRHDSEISIRDAGALLNMRGPSSSDQGDRLLSMLEKIERRYVKDYAKASPVDGDKGFHKDFIEGREVALAHGLSSFRHKFKVLVDEVSQVITNPDSPRDKKRSRTPPR